MPHCSVVRTTNQRQTTRSSSRTPFRVASSNSHVPCVPDNLHASGAMTAQYAYGPAICRPPDTYSFGGVGVCGSFTSPLFGSLSSGGGVCGEVTARGAHGS
jgi:hypothetical protein